MSNWGLDVAEAAQMVGVSKPTLRRMFDNEQPASGLVIEDGRTGGKERRVDPGWAEAKRSEKAASTPVISP